MNPRRTPKQIFSAILGFVMLAVASPCVVGMIYDLTLGATDNVSGALIAGTFFAFVGLGGLALMVFGLRRPKADDLRLDEALERRILTTARSHGGRLTVSELAVDCELSLAEANHALTHLERHGIVRTHLSDAGDIVYVFRDFTVDKASAVDPLDDEAVFDAALEDAQDSAEAVLAAPVSAKNEDW